MGKRTLALLLAVMFVAGCNREPPLTVEQQVTLRANAWASALLEKSVDRAFELTSPGYRSTRTVGQYYAEVAGAGMWTDAGVEKAVCAGERCEVQLNVTYTHPRLNVTTTKRVSQIWLKTENQWWLFVQ